MADVRYERADDVAILVLDRPEARNAVSKEMFEGLIEGIRWAESVDARAIVLAGAGGYFCAGLDLKEIAARAGAEEQLLLEWLPAGNAMVRAFHATPLPSVSAVTGGALGAAFSLALVPDFCIAGRSAKFSPQYLKLGMTPDIGLSYFLTRRLGPGRAANLLLRSPVLDAPAALAAGVIDEVVDDDAVLDAAVALAGEIGARVPTTIQGVRALTRAALANTLDQQLEEEERWVQRAFHANPAFQSYASAFRARGADRDGWTATSGLS
jgi:2-(1,2-epoxy-1,2-dihydrophenyl)acetyl-CoA isomerase